MSYVNFSKIILGFLFISTLLRAEEFLYPVASFEKDGQEQVYLLYQKSIRHIELWVWDPKTTTVNKALLSSYTPAGLRILPDKSGFSFIDNGRIKIKHFAKRSPKSLDLYEPIYEIGIIEWIDSSRCYFSAKENERTAIFQATMNGELKKIVGSSAADCIYPQKIGDQLFYIERRYPSYKIMQMPYPEIVYDASNNFNNVENFDMRVQELLKKQEKRNNQLEAVEAPKNVMVDFNEQFNGQALAFLQMVSETVGYVISHPNAIDKQDKTIPLVYYQLSKESDSWHCVPLFSFEIPLDLLMPERTSRLYESMLPLLPRRFGNEIYFVDCAQARENCNLNIYIYHLVDGKIKQLSGAREIGKNFFAPIKTARGIYYGGSMEPDSDAPPCMKINEDGCMCFELPLIIQ